MEPQPTARGVSLGWWFSIAVAALLIAAGWLLGDVMGRKAEPPAPAPPLDAAPGEPASRRAIVGDPFPIFVPPLDATDTLVRELIRRLTSHPRVLAWLTTDDLIRTFTVVVNEVSTGSVPARSMTALGPNAPFQTVERNGRTVDPRSYQRYVHVAHIVSGLRPSDVGRVYATLKPRIDEAHRDRGTVDVSFDETLRRAILLITSAPVSESPMQVEIRGATFGFVNRRVEDMPPVQKQMLRMGPENAFAIQKAIREIGWALGLEV